MKNRLNIFFTAAGIVLALANSTDAAWSPRIKSPEPLVDVATLPADIHYRRACDFYNSSKWTLAASEFRLVAVNFPETSYGQDAYFFLGVSYYNMAEYDLANEAFSNYLQCHSNPRYFNDAIEYKFHIAENFRSGSRKRLMGARQMPKWGSGYDLAIEIYDEVIPAMPNHDMAMHSMYGKGTLLWTQRQYRESVEAFQQLIGRFPKSEFAPECFVLINRIYLDQCQREFQNPDLLALAEINLRRFEQQFPGEERIEVARRDMLRIKEVYAKGLYETATFYERIDQPGAAVIYYQKAIADFPETRISRACRSRLSTFCPQALIDIDEKVRERSLQDEEVKEQVPDFIEFTGIGNGRQKDAV